jgi:acetyl-CoA carboxylase carboxyltransferase component
VPAFRGLVPHGLQTCMMVNVMTKSKIEELRTKRDELLQGGGPARIAKQHDAGKLTARERIALLFEDDTFRESLLFMKHRCVHFGLAGKEFPGEGVVTGHGIVDGRPVYVVSQDFTVAGGSVGEATGEKISQAMDAALKTGDPVVMINDSGGARIQEGVDSLSSYGKIFYRNILLSGVVPQISIIAGPCAGGAAYSPALTDFIIQVRHEGQMYITGPLVIKAMPITPAWSISLPRMTRTPSVSPGGCCRFCRAITPRTHRSCPICMMSGWLPMNR